MRRLVPLIALAALLAACGSSSTGSASSASASESASMSASASPSASGTTSETPAPAPSPTGPDALQFCQAAASLYSALQQSTDGAQAAMALTIIAKGMRDTAPAEIKAAGDSFAKGLVTLAAGISDGSIDGAKAGTELQKLVQSKDANDIATYCKKVLPSASPSPSAS